MKYQTRIIGAFTCAIIMPLVAILAIHAGTTANAETSQRPTFGNHNLNGIYAFRADGVVEVNGEPTRGLWEVGRFEADGDGTMTAGVEYSSLLSASDESIIDIPYTFTGTYDIDSTGMGRGHVSVYIPAAGITIEKDLWFVVFDLDEQGIAHGFAHGHADADLGGGAHGNTRTHVGRRMASVRRP